MTRDIVQLAISTRDGLFVASYSANGLTKLDFPSKRCGPVKLAGVVASPVIRCWHRATTAALKRVLAGRAPGTWPPLDFSCGTAFQRKVWRAMLEIGCGETKSYGEIARVIGRPKAVRAVGGACGANPIPVLVPCHRVIAARRKLGGFSGDLNWKRTLLAREGVQLGG